MRVLIIFLLMLLSCLSETHGSKILLVFALPSKSHYILGMSLARGLVIAGHDVTMITKFTDKAPQGKGSFKYITIPDCSAVNNNSDENEFNYFELEKANALINIPFMNFFGEGCTKNVFESESVQKLLKSNEKFDVVIVELLLTDGLTVFGHHFNAPVILLSPLGVATWVNNLIGNPAPPSYIPNMFLGYNDYMSFWERSKNAGIELLSYLNLNYYFYPRQTNLIKKYFPNSPSVAKLHENVALILSNSHESVNSATPKVPNIIDIGGYHISKSKKLPEDLQKILDGATKGVIYFSLGSHVKPSQMKPEMRNAILKVFGSLKETIIWKWDEEKLPETPPNVIVGTWFPQQELLAHPNVKLFITHAGLLSLIETVYIGVPILALPVLGDQKMNAMKAEMLQIGKHLSFSELTEDTLQAAIHELLDNKKYTETVKRRSSLIRDRPIQPLDLAVYWVEFVIRHKGAPHLKVVGVNLSWYQYFLLDVIVFWSFVLIIIITVIFKLIRKLCCVSKVQKLKKS